MQLNTAMSDWRWDGRFVAATSVVDVADVSNSTAAAPRSPYAVNMTMETSAPAERPAASRSLMIPGAWERRRAMTLVPASQTGAVSVLAPAMRIAATSQAAEASAAERSPLVRVSVFVGVMLLATWLALWLTSLSAATP